MDSEARQPTPVSASTWRPARILLMAAFGIYLLLSALLWGRADSTFEFWVLIILGPALIFFAASDALVRLRRGR